jgi:UDP-N-acetylglucosamine 2-epimerase (non-hydrolysing)
MGSTNRLKVMTVFGTRPDTIKMAPVVAALRAHPAVDDIVCVTAQHRDMLDDLLELFAIVPDHDLNIMTADQSLTEITTRVLIGMEPVLARVRPDVVLVHGDTTTSSSAALATFYQHIPVGHVEAGLRTSDRWLPYPEEMNRRLTGTIASYHFSPTQLAREHLIRENVAVADVVVTGNTVIDAFLTTAGRSELPAPPRFDEIDPKRPLVLVTAHRRENHEHMRGIAAAVRDMVRLPQRPQVYWPVHPSPNVRPAVLAEVGGVPGVLLVDPIDYARMVSVVKASSFVLTDSGGLQEEAPCLGKPVLVMRGETERPEGLDAGTLRLVGHERSAIVAAAAALLGDKDVYDGMAQATNPYGDGRAAERIVAWLLARLRGLPYPAPYAPAP